MPQKLVKSCFTLCSNNYYSQAITCAKSYCNHHPFTDFYIIIVDRKHDDILYYNDKHIQNVFIEQIGLSNLQQLIDAYNIIELNTSVKPSVFKFLLKKGYDLITYLDPDIFVFSPFEEIMQFHAEENPIIVTPHMLHPRDSERPYTDHNVLKFGIFNLGFISILQSDVADAFLDWWEDRLEKYCYIDISKGMFTDQLWINHLPVFFPEALILRHYGYNVAYWNLNERVLNRKGDKLTVNEESLRFFHFSHFKPQINNKLVYNFEVEIEGRNKNHVKTMTDNYKKELISNHHLNSIKVKCYFYPPVPARVKLLNRMKKFFKLG